MISYLVKPLHDQFKRATSERNERLTPIIAAGLFAETPARIAKTQVMKIARLRQRFGIAHALCFVLLVALVALRISTPLLEDLRNRAFDFYQFARPRIAEQRQW